MLALSSERGRLVNTVNPVPEVAGDSHKAKAVREHGFESLLKVMVLMSQPSVPVDGMLVTDRRIWPLMVAAD